MASARDRGGIPIWAMVTLIIIFAAFTAIDWYRFVEGIGEETLWRVAKSLKLAFTLVCALVVLLGRPVAHDRGDWLRLSVAFALILAGDVAFFMVWSMPAVGIFTLAQVAMTVRNASGLPGFIRSGGLTTHRGRAIGTAAAILLVDVAIISSVFRDFLVEAGPVVATVGVLYALFLSLSVWVAWMAPVVGRFPSRPARMIAVAMTLFYFCDVSVGLGGVFDGELPGALSRNLTWLFYGPALVLLVSSGRSLYLSAPRR